MGMEIERKFLVQGSPWQEHESIGHKITQGYLSTDPQRTIRVRLCESAVSTFTSAVQESIQSTAFITIKSHISTVSCHEFEYAIPPQEARILLDTLVHKPLIEKIRHRIVHEGHTWEIDVFSGSNAGLVLAEIELSHEEEVFFAPPWLLEEVTHNTQYKNSQLVHKPYSTW